MRQAMRITPLSYALHAEGESPVYGETAITVRVEDDAAGPYLELFSEGSEGMPLKVDFDDWPLLTEIVERLRKEHAGEPAKEK